jgi:molecular chaperone GrpE (heat shock protein)
LSLLRDQTPADPQLSETLDRIGEDVRRLRKTVLKHGHAQELFQQRVEEAVGRLAGEAGENPSSGLSEVQLRVLLELDRALVHLQDLTRGESRRQDSGGLEDAPESVREGLGLLQIRVRNLQRSFGLEPIQAVGATFDDRRHRAHSLCHRPDLPDGQVVEELLPGYLLDGRVVRPALVIVNRSERDPLQGPAGEQHS